MNAASTPSNRMELGPIDYKITIKCNRCGKIKPNDKLEALLWYCNDYEKEFGTYKYQTKAYSDYVQVDYCPNCIQSQQEKEVVLRGIRNELSSFVKLGFNIGGSLKALIKQQVAFQNDCKWFIDTLNSFNEFKIDSMKKKIKTALDYSNVDVQLLLF